MNHLKTYPAHLALYLIAAVDFASQLPALGALAPFAPYITAAGAMSAALHHSYQTGAASQVVQAVTTAPAKLMLAMFMLALVLGVTSGLSACATAPTVMQQGGIVAAVDIGTGLAISEAGKVTDPAKLKARAVEFKAIAVELKGVNDAGNATLATLSADLAPLVAKLPPADQLAAASLEAVLIPYLQSQIPGNANIQNTQTTVDVVLAALISACEAYGA